ncbi:MAG: hypothetical protein JNJ54_20960 [Myxococcaceae bacterium]|nr:hypothetical protein [Myxococcaceae bacterium]
MARDLLNSLARRSSLTRTGLAVGAVLLAVGCLPNAGECIGNAIGQSLGIALGTAIGDGFGGPVGLTRPDEARVTDAGTFVSVAHQGGRLELRFADQVLTGELPRRDPSCVMTDYAIFRDADAGVALVTLNVVSASQAPADGGTRVRLDCKALKRKLPDAGMEALGERVIDVLAP